MKIYYVGSQFYIRQKAEACQTLGFTITKSGNTPKSAKLGDVLIKFFDSYFPDILRGSSADVWVLDESVTEDTRNMILPNIIHTNAIEVRQN